ncbi:DUF4911 domain-containing protein [bacterium]|nr:DUF4911 domain-containing protein [bacterium]
MTRPSLKNKGLNIHIRTEARHIWRITGIFEGYDGLAVVRTIDREKGMIELLSSKDQEDELREMLENLSKEITIIVLD